MGMTRCAQMTGPAHWCAMTHLHCPLLLSHSEMAASTVPFLEQLQVSQPARGWKLKAFTSQTSHWGLTVRGGQRHFPVTSSQRRLPQLQAAEEQRDTA